MRGKKVKTLFYFFAGSVSVGWKLVFFLLLLIFRIFFIFLFLLSLSLSGPFWFASNFLPPHSPLLYVKLWLSASFRVQLCEQKPTRLSTGVVV